MIVDNLASNPILQPLHRLTRLRQPALDRLSAARNPVCIDLSKRAQPIDIALIILPSEQGRTIGQRENARKPTPAIGEDRIAVVIKCARCNRIVQTALDDIIIDAQIGGKSLAVNRAEPLAESAAFGGVRLISFERQIAQLSIAAPVPNARGEQGRAIEQVLPHILAQLHQAGFGRVLDKPHRPDAIILSERWLRYSCHTDC